MNFRTVPQKRTDKYTLLKQKVIDFMRRQPHISVPELVAETECSEYAVLRVYSSARRELFARAR